MAKVMFKAIGIGFTNLATALEGQAGEILNSETRDGVEVLNVQFEDRVVYGVPATRFDPVVE